MPPRIVKPFAQALNLAYERAMRAREAVEHRLVSIPQQELIVRQWRDNLPRMAAELYPRHDVLSYPVQTRMQRDFEKFERYQSELQERLEHYATALQTIEQTSNNILVATNRDSSSEPTVLWPACPSMLCDDPWPHHWPPRPDQPSCETPSAAEYFFNTDRPLPPRRLPSPTSFSINIAGQEVKLYALYEDGISPFIIALEEFLYGTSSSRWPAIIEATRCGIRWPQLDSYLDECKNPWLPLDFVGTEFGLRGTLSRRDELADVMALISPDAGRWYLSEQPRRCRLNDLLNGHDILEELMVIGLVRWGPDMAPSELLRELPFLEVKSLFASAGLSPPRGYDAAVARYDDLVSIYGKEKLQCLIRSFVDTSTVIEVREIEGWDREERLGPRARANVLVSTLVLLHEGELGPLCVINWRG